MQNINPAGQNMLFPMVWHYPGTYFASYPTNIWFFNQQPVSIQNQFQIFNLPDGNQQLQPSQNLTPALPAVSVEKQVISKPKEKKRKNEEI